MKTMLKIIMSAILVSVTTVGLLTGCSGDSQVPDSSQSAGQTVINKETDKLLKQYTSEKNLLQVINGKPYYFSGHYMFLLNDNGTVTVPTITWTSEEEPEARPYAATDIHECAFDGNNIYQQYKSDCENIYMDDFSDTSNFTKNILINEKWLEIFLGEKYQCILSGMTDFQADGDYIYFRYEAPRENFHKTLNENYRLGRFKKDGSSIELLNDIANDFIVKDGWIYFYDNGYTYDKSNNKSDLDLSRAGIYKMKTDGSEKTLLLGELRSDYMDYAIYRICDNLKIYGDLIYFQKFDENDDSKVYCMSLDGSNLKAVTKESAFNYTVSGDMLFYSTGKRLVSQIDPRSLKKVFLNDGSEEEMFKISGSYYLEFTVYNNYLYFNDGGTRMYAKCIKLGSDEKPSCCGQRYNLLENKMENIYGYQIAKIVLNNDGFETYSLIKGDTFYWKDAVNSENGTGIPYPITACDSEFSMPDIEES